MCCALQQGQNTLFANRATLCLQQELQLAAPHVVNNCVGCTLCKGTLGHWAIFIHSRLSMQRYTECACAYSCMVYVLTQVQPCGWTLDQHVEFDAFSLKALELHHQNIGCSG